MSTEAQIKSEIERLTASINQHKNSGYAASGPGRGRGGISNPGGYQGYGGYNDGQSAGRRSNVWTNKYVRPGLAVTSTGAPSTTSNTTDAASTLVTEASTCASASDVAVKQASTPTSTSVTSTRKKEIVLNGVAFESSARSLVRKDLPRPQPTTTAKKPPSMGHTPTYPYVRKSGHLIGASRTYKPKSRRGRNMTLNNTRIPYRERLESKKRKYLNKPCPRFTTTGACNRGLTCMYQHDPTKIAICWNFLQDNCPKTAETCNLSHDPTPERTPLCLHFLNKGRCTRGGCLFPHVNVGKREGVCRDFAVLGYCEKGLDCDKQHVRECPDFAERGTCGTKGCKLPHVIRANRGRKVAPVKPTAGTVDTDTSTGQANSTDIIDSSAPGVSVYAEDSQLGDEYISLTFHETESEEEESSSGEDEDGDDVSEAEDLSS